MEHNIAYQYAILTEITYQKIIWDNGKWNHSMAASCSYMAWYMLESMTTWSFNGKWNHPMAPPHTGAPWAVSKQ